MDGARLRPRAAEAAQKAFDASAGLNREDRLNVEGRLADAQQNWTKAAEVYRTLWGFFSDNAEYGLRLAAVQTNAGLAREALDTLVTIRRLPPPQGQDPRIDSRKRRPPPRSATSRGSSKRCGA